MAEEVDREEKTEEATPRRRDEAREQGQVAISTELGSVAMLAAAILVVVVAGAWMAQGAGALVAGSLVDVGQRGAGELTITGSSGLLLDAAQALGWQALALIVPLFAIGLLVSYAQIGFQITPKAIEWNPSRLNPVAGMQRIFSLQSVVRTASALLKITLISAVVAIVAWQQIPSIVALHDSELGPVLAAIGMVLLRCCLAALIVAAAIAVGDFAWQRFRHERDLRMSKKEVRDELKNTEGDPHIKARIRAMQRERARGRMMQDVPKATVVVTTPTHYAVALAYDQEDAKGRRSAPYVVAKGVDAVAQKIKEVAREHDILLYEDVPLARALHAQVDIGEEIPEQFYQAVAAVLAYVYRVKEEGALAR